ncbi:MAG: ISL3 family transposase [Acidobacteria bacterium]|nr:ISL3 family transposase [Acidobacteriota bacterium]
MQLQTILNRVEKYKSFVYGPARWVEDAERLTLEVELRSRKNGRPVCSGCGRVRPGYDRLPERRYQFVPLWGILVFFVYAPRRVDCRSCGVKVEQLPWCEGKHRLTTSYRWFLARWAKRMSWSEVAAAFHTSWDNVFRSVKYAVSWGLKRRDLKRIKAIGVDEIQWQRGHHYLTLVYQIEEGLKRLLWVGRERTEQSLAGFFDRLGPRRSRRVKFICSDMCQAYLTVIAARAPRAVHVLDRFHIMQNFGKALDEIRAAEARQLKADGYEPLLKHSRWCLLKRPENLTQKQAVKLEELLRYNLRSVRAYLLRDDFQQFWECRQPAAAGQFLDEWCTRTLRTRLDPLKKVARTLRGHRELLLNWFRARGTISAGVVEGLNSRAKLTMRKSFGFRTPEAIETALFHTLGRLPEPEFTHEFC